MNYLNAIIFGIAQGLTEFLPVSSSGHLVLLHEFINLPLGNELAFDVFLHLATLFAVIFYFRKDVYEIIISWLKSFGGEKNEMSKLGWLIILGTVPAAFAGFFFESLFESIFRSSAVVAFMLILVGGLFLIAEKFSKKTLDLNNLNARKAIFIGIAQAIALIPGTSRSGITIITGLASGLKRQAALRFSFLLSIPIIFGATIKKTPAIWSANYTLESGIVLFLAFTFSFLSGYLAIKFFLQFAEKHPLNIFAYYRFVLAIIVILFSL